VTLRRLLRGSLLYTIGNFLPRVGAFLLLPVYAAAMAPDEFGIFSLLLSGAGLLAILYRLGLDGALLRLHFDVDDRQRPTLYLTLALGTLAVAALFSAAGLLVGARLFDGLGLGIPFWPHGAVAVLLAFILAFQYVPTSFYRAMDWSAQFVAVTFGAFVVGVAATLFLLLVLRLGAVGALLGQAVGAIVLFIAAAAIILRHGHAAPDSRLLRRAYAFGLPLVPHAFSGWVLNLSDRWLIGLLIGGGAGAAHAAVGIYSFGYLLGQVVSLVALSFNAAWSPVFYAHGERPGGPRMLRHMTSLMACGLATLASLIGSLAPELTALIAEERWGPSADMAAAVVPIVAFASVTYGIYFMVVGAIFVTRRTARLPLLTMVAGALNVSANVVLIPRLGIVGAALGTLIGYGSLAILTGMQARRLYPLDLDLPRLILVLGAVASALGIGVALGPEAGPAGLAIRVPLASIAILVAVLAARAPVRDLRTLLVTSDPPGRAARMAAPKEDA